MKRAERGFAVEEYQQRVERAQMYLREAGIDALLVTTEPEFRYFTGFLTRFWESPTRPWFLLVPCEGEPVAVIPSIGENLLAKGWISDIRTWPSPHPEDDGVSLLAEAIRESVAPSGSVGLPMGAETHLRQPLADFRKLAGQIEPIKFRDDAGTMTRLRLIKSEAEIEKITQACGIADRAFGRIGEIASADTPLASVFRRFQMLCLDEGADWVAYLAGGAGPDGYGDVISPATEAPLRNGDILMLDTGVVWDGYFCDYDRNFSIGPASELAASTHTLLLEATQAGLETAKPGATAEQLFRAMDAVLRPGARDEFEGRLGHGLGMQLTEWPSLKMGDDTVLQEGMVLTLEPYAATRDGAIMVHEENIVIRAGKPQLLTRPAEERLQEL